MAVVGPCADDAADVHGLLRLPQPRPAPPPRPRPRRRRAARALDALRAELADTEIVHAPGARSAGATVRGSPPPCAAAGTPTCASRSSATWPACSATGPPARAATPTICDSPACRPSWSRPCSTPARPWWWWSCPAVRTRSAPSRRAAGAGPGVHARRGGRAGDRRRALRARRARRSAAGADPARPGGQPGTYLQPPLGIQADGPPTWTRRRCTPSGTGVRTPASPSTTLR